MRLAPEPANRARARTKLATRPQHFEPFWSGAQLEYAAKRPPGDD